jgi:nitronate monooxygenase
MARASMDDMVVTVANEGLLASLGAAYLSPKELRTSIRNIQSKTHQPFQVNLQAPAPFPIVDNPSTIDSQSLHSQFESTLAQIKKELSFNKEMSEPKKLDYTFEDQLKVVLEEKIRIFSFTFGCPTKEQIESLQNNNTIVMGTVTSVEEAKFLESRGVDYIIAQGSESGGHRGTFLTNVPQGSEMLSTLALVPQIVDAVKIPVIATGGIYDGRGIHAALSLGASLASLGTIFLPCKESSANDLWKRALLDRTKNRPTVVTRAATGRHCRVIKNTLIEKISPVNSVLRPLPYHNAYMKDLYADAQKQGNDEYIPLLAGQGYRSLRNVPLEKYPNAGELAKWLISELQKPVKSKRLEF